MIRVEWVIPAYLIGDIRIVLSSLGIQGALFLPVHQTCGFTLDEAVFGDGNHHLHLLVVYCPTVLKTQLMASIDLLDYNLCLGCTTLETDAAAVVCL
jgi:hypothetical protein